MNDSLDGVKGTALDKDSHEGIDDVIYETVYDLAEGSTDNNTDCHIKNITLGNELLEGLEKGFFGSGHDKNSFQIKFLRQVLFYTLFRQKSIVLQYFFRKQSKNY
jgi:hypothetical protein